MTTKKNNENILKFFVPTIVELLVVIFDQFSKLIASQFLDVGESITIIPNVLNFTYVQNTGAAFSMLQGHTVFLIIFTAIAMLVCVYVIVKDFFQSALVNWALLLCIGGGIGNIIDRIRWNYVVDFIECKLFEFPVFNVADIAVTFGAGLICIYIIKELFLSIIERKSEE